MTTTEQVQPPLATADAPTPLAQASALVDRARALLAQDSQRANDLAEQAMALTGGWANRAGRQITMACATLLVKARYQLGDLAEALVIGQQALTYVSDVRPTPDTCGLLSRMTWIYADIGRFERALTLSRRAFRQARRIDSRSWEAQAYSDLGVIYDRWGKADESSAAMLKIVELGLVDALSGEEKALICYNLAEAYLNLDQLIVALEYVEAGLAAARLSCLLSMRGTLMARLGDESSAEQMFYAACDLARTVHDFFDEYYSLYELAKLRRRQGKLDEAVAAIDAALAAVVAAPTLQLPCLSLRGELLAERGDFQAAYVCLQQLGMIREHVHSEQVTRQARASEVEFRAEMAQREARLERKKNVELRRYIAELEHLQEELRELSLRDALTGLFNRRYLSEQLDLLLKQSARRAAPLAVAIFDIDRFKDINDGFSHHVGDLVLTQVAAIAQTAVRSSDVLARYGGEEFVILLIDTPLEQAAAVCERLRGAVASYDWTSLQPGLAVTISLGLAASADQAAQIHSDLLLRRADSQMYLAKKRGRNQVCW
jgi:diguanylate cyclase (GGDEF)-like protein